MVVVQDGKLAFSKDRIISATQASKNFGECRQRVHDEPLFVTDRNASVDTVIMDYADFEAMALELEKLRLEHLYAVAARRVQAIDSGEAELIAFEDLIGKDSFNELLSDDDGLSDEDLFE